MSSHPTPEQVTNTLQILHGEIKLSHLPQSTSTVRPARRWHGLRISSVRIHALQYTGWRRPHWASRTAVSGSTSSHPSISTSYLAGPGWTHAGYLEIGVSAKKYILLSLPLAFLQHSVVSRSKAVEAVWVAWLPVGVHGPLGYGREIACFRFDWTARTGMQIFIGVFARHVCNCIGVVELRV